MDAGRGGKGSPGGRPPPKRTYGSSQGSRQTFRRDGQHYAIRGDSSSILPAASSANLGSSVHSTHATPALLQPELSSDGLNVSEVAGARGLQSAGRFGGAVGGGVRSVEKISQLVREAGEGGEGGRISTIAVAQACKSREMRKAMRVNAAEIISELTSAMSVSLRHQRDEAIVHGLAVTMFILSKDRVLVKAFSASAVSTLAVLIQGERGQDTVREDTVSAHNHGAARAPSAAAAAAAAAVRQEKSLSKTMGTIDDKYSSSSRCRDSALQSKSKVSSPFDMSDDDEEEAPVGVGSSFGVDKALSRGRRTETDGRILPENGSASSDTNGHVSTTVMVRARMLLDIADMVPWGMANRHLVSAADLGLATLLNVTSQACPESGGAAGAGGESVDEEFSTQGSMASQSEPGSAVGSLVNGQAEGSEPATARNAGVVPELSRLAPSGFLLPLVIVGATVLGDLSAGTSSLTRSDVDAEGASDAAADPSSLRSVHQLLLALRLLDLATLENSGEGDGTAATAATAPKPAQTPPSHHYAELTGALLLVVANCIPLCGGSTAATAAGFGKGKAPAAGRGGGGRNQQSAPVAMGKEVAAKVHECLLAALRVLINVTHHDGRACAEVAAKGGLDTLMSCLVARSYCGSQWSDSSGGSGLAAAHPKSDLAILEDVVNGVGEDMPRSGLEQGSADNPGDFDAQVLSMSALINCVELKESADNCTAMARLAVHPPGARVADDRRKQQQEQQQLPTVGGLASSRCLAPEFLAKLLVRCTRSFAHQLGGDRPGEDGEEELVSAAPAKAQQAGRGIKGRSSSDGGGSSTALAVPATGERMASAASAIPQEGDSGEQLMSHSEGTDLVLGGHCALLLGLLVRDQESNRRLALPLLPDGDPNLIVRVLEAFMALQFQAGVLTEEIVLAVQGLVEELEGLEALPVEEWNPFELDATDEVATAVAEKPAAGATGATGGASSDIATTSSTQRDRKRPRSLPSNDSIPLPVERVCANPRSGQWVGEAGEGNDSSADDISSTAKRPRTAAARVEPTPSLWMNQSPCRQTDPPSKLSKPSVMSSSASTQDFSSEKRTSAATPSKYPSSGDSGETPPSRNHTPGSTTASSSWRVAGTSIAGRIGMGIRGRSAAGARSWLGSSPQLRTYGSRRTYGSQKWKNKPSPPNSGQHASPVYHHVGKEAGASPGGKPSSIILEVLPDDSEGESATKSPRNNSGGGSGKESGVRTGGVGPRSGRGGTGVTTATSSSFDVDDWSDSSNEPAAKSKISRVTKKCQLHSPASSRGGRAGVSGGAGCDDRVAAQSKNERCRRRSPSPSPPRAAARAAGSSSSPRSRVGFGGGGVANEAAVAPTADVRTVVGQGPRPASGEITSQPPTGRPGVSEWQQGSGEGAGKGAGVLRAPVVGGGGGRGRIGGSKEPPTRRVFGAGAGTEGRGGVAKSAHRNVFEMSDEDESD